MCILFAGFLCKVDASANINPSLQYSLAVHQLAYGKGWGIIAAVSLAMHQPWRAA
jgi:hypothetical protein